MYGRILLLPMNLNRCHFGDKKAIPSAKEAAEQWLREWIASADCPDYETVMAAIKGEQIADPYDSGVSYSIEDYGDGPNLFFKGLDAHSSIPPEFWHHYEIATGEKVPERFRFTGFSCSC